MAIKKQNSHTSTRKKASASRATSPHAKKAAAKASKSGQKAKAAKKKADRLERLKKLEELTLRAFRMAYESNQRGEFRRL
jgi:hypothetical protein